MQHFVNFSVCTSLIVSNLIAVVYSINFVVIIFILLVLLIGLYF
jgi:hypothetical protein